MKILILTITFFFLHVVYQSPYTKLQKLEGQWRMNTPMGPIFEEWKQDGENQMVGKSYKLKGADTIVMETIKLKREDKYVYYIPTVSNQNNGEPVAFTMVSDKDDRYVFEFLAHDFPQRIIYRFVHNDSIVARIEGVVKGKEKWSEFYYGRVK